MRAESDRQGFTLLEVLIALAILSLVLGSVLATLSTGLRAAGGGKTRLEALARAEALMAQADAGAFPTGIHQGADDAGFTWELQVTPGPTHGPSGLDPVTLTATVAWDDGRRTVRLRTLTLRPDPGGTP